MIVRDHMKHPNIVTVQVFSSEIEANIAKGALEANNIEAVVLTDDAGGMNPSLAYTNGVRLAVREEDVKKAQKILKISE
jgi:hypothetical protein